MLCRASGLMFPKNKKTSRTENTVLFSFLLGGLGRRLVLVPFGGLSFGFPFFFHCSLIFFLQRFSCYIFRLFLRNLILCCFVHGWTTYDVKWRDGFTYAIEVGRWSHGSICLGGVNRRYQRARYFL